MRDHHLSPWPQARGVRAARRAGTGHALRPAPAPELPCRADPDLFFAEDPQDLERARQLCAGCPVRAACLGGALQRGEPWGVWGGEIVQRGTVIAAKRARGRPRKADVAA